MRNTIVSISPRITKTDSRRVIVIALDNGKNIVREQYQFDIDCANSLMDEEDARTMCVGGTVEGDYTFNAKGTKYALTAESRLVKSGAINPETNKPYAVGDVVERQTDSIRVNGFLTFHRSPAMQETYLIAKMRAKLQNEALRKPVVGAGAHVTSDPQIFEHEEGDEGGEGTALPEGGDTSQPAEQPAA